MPNIITHGLFAKAVYDEISDQKLKEIIKETKAINKVEKAFLNIYNVILSFLPAFIMILLFEWDLEAM